MKRFLFLAAVAFVGCVTSPTTDSPSINLNGRWGSSDGKTILTFNGNAWVGKFFLRSDGKSIIGISANYQSSGQVDSIYETKELSRICKPTCVDTVVSVDRVAISIDHLYPILQDGSLGAERNPDDFSPAMFQKIDGKYRANGAVTDSTIDMFLGVKKIP